MEMELVAVTTGKVSLGDINRDDLVCLDPFLARALDVQLGFVSPDDQDGYFGTGEWIPRVAPQSGDQVTHTEPPGFIRRTVEHIKNVAAPGGDTIARQK